MKTFATVGFLAIIVLLVWLAVQIVSFIPSAFSSLASLADSVYSNRPTNEIVVSNGNSIVGNGEAFTISWTDTKKTGEYTFSYQCAEGVSLDMRYPGNTITPVSCGEIVNLGESTLSLDVITRAEKRRFTDLTYTIGFVPRGEVEPLVSKDVIVTIVNANIPQGITVETPVDVPVVETPVVETPVTETPAKPSITTPVKPVVKPTYVTTYGLPKSNPNGNIDLAVKYLGVGTMNANNVFIPGGVIDNDARGAFQFEVMNIGTKTSGDWDFTATLTSGSKYNSATQAALKPNERSVITLGFDTVGDVGVQRFGAGVSTKNDSNKKNNDFSSAVNVVN